MSSTIARHFRAYSAAHVHTLVSGHVVTMAIGAPIVAIVWLWLAWANGRGHGWARILFGVLFGLTSLSLLVAVGQHALTYAPVDVIAGAALWTVALVGFGLIISSPSEGHYHRRRDTRGRRDARRIVPVGPSLN